ncbi:hypothetical protein SADUNF_Sadunf09G0118000 [Salix dunnii]|uniref:Uncharacterized protein n=1 Tax=Salix dunnii TaxID=1413687 RepID=A0A835JYL7_9ROSI|nr:hypothetical protein SADUNF_Sadunf09G0118000 [Salix dunnii]
MPLSVERKPQVESSIVGGVLDTGVYIDAPSFADKGFGPPPSSWKGACQIGSSFNGCNKHQNHQGLGSIWYTGFGAQHETYKKQILSNFCRHYAD